MEKSSAKTSSSSSSSSSDDLLVRLGIGRWLMVSMIYLGWSAGGPGVPEWVIGISKVARGWERVGSMPSHHFVAFLSTDPIRESNPYDVITVIKLNISITFNQL